MVTDLIIQYPGVLAGIGSVSAILIAVYAKLQYKNKHRNTINAELKNKLV
jgi:hypothetical protein